MRHCRYKNVSKEIEGVSNRITLRDVQWSEFGKPGYLVLRAEYSMK